MADSPYAKATGDRSTTARATVDGSERAARREEPVTVLVLYLLLLKATVTSFAGMGSLPQIERDLVETYRLLSSEQLSQAVLVGRSTPGPLGAYVVAVGYLAGGGPGALAGWLAMITPAFAAIPLLATMQRWIHRPRMRAMVDAVVIASATLLVASGVRLAADAVQQLTRVFSG
jgi:chromate transporter